MISKRRLVVAGIAGLVLLRPLPERGQDTQYLTGPEVDQLRDAQDPSERIKVYLDFSLERLEQMDELHAQTPELDEGPNSDFRRLLSQYVSITDEMKDWISDQYQRNGDMRKGLKDLMERGPKEVEELRDLEGGSGTGATGAQKKLQDAIDDTSDAVDGGSKALSEQIRKFGELEKDKKVEAKDVKEQRKEQEKRQKEEKKLRKELDKKHSSEDSPEN